MGAKLRQKDYRTGYKKGFEDALKFAMEAVTKEFDKYDRELQNDKADSSSGLSFVYPAGYH